MQAKEERNKKLLRRRTVGLVVAAVLLANPVWALTDLLPDLLAWWIVWVALLSFAELNDRMEHARKYALWLFGVEAVKLLCAMWLRNETVSSNRMLATAIFCAVEGTCMWIFFRSFMTGCEELSRAGNGDTMFSRVENVGFLCKLFIVVRMTCTLLPELTAIPEVYLDNPELTNEELYAIMLQLANMRGLLIAVFFVLEIVVAVMWLVSFLPFVRLLYADNSLREHLCACMAQEDGDLYMRRSLSRFRSARICFAVALAATADLQIDGVRFFPVCIFPILLVVGLRFLQLMTKAKPEKTVYGMALGTFAVLLASEIYRQTCTVWDLRVYAQITVGQEILSGLVAFVGMLLLLLLWLLFAARAERISAAMGCKGLGLSGLPYWLLVLYAMMQAVMFTLPLTGKFLVAPRLIAAVAFWWVSNRRFAAWEEQLQEVLSLRLRDAHDA